MGVIVQIFVGMKLWLLIIGTILVYITVSNDAKRLNGDMIDGNPTSLVEEQEGMVRVKRAAGARKGVKQGRMGGRKTTLRKAGKKGRGKQKGKRGRKWNPFKGKGRRGGPLLKP